MDTHGLDLWGCSASSGSVWSPVRLETIPVGAQAASLREHGEGQSPKHQLPGWAGRAVLNTK